MKIKMLLAVALCFAVQAQALTAWEARAMEETRNAGQYEMEGQTGPEAEKFSSFWQMPESDLDPKWGTDVLISPYDSVYSVSLARDPSTGNLFAVLSKLSGGIRSTSMHFSNNGGLTWSNTVNLVGTGRHPSSAMVMGNHCYYAYGTNAALRLRRVHCATGAVANFSGGAAYFDILATTADTIKEVSLTELWDNTQLCCGTIHKDGKLRVFWTSDTSGTNWTQLASPEGAADRGLDIYGNYPYSSYLLFASYYTSTNLLRILGAGYGGVWDTLGSGWVGPTSLFTAAGAYRDTVLVAFESVVDDHGVALYVASYDGGSTWSSSTYLSTSGTFGCSPDVAMRGGGGTGAVFIQSTPYYFKWRPYVGAWTANVYVSNYGPSIYHKPSLEYLGGGKYGVAYISNTATLNKAYFDRSDWVVGVEDGQIQNEKLKIQNLKLRVYGNTIEYSIPQNGAASIKIYNLLGQEVRTLVNEFKSSGVYNLQWNGRDAGNRRVSSGVYLVRLVSGDKTATAKMVIVR